jgi:hypothetical protein
LSATEGQRSRPPSGTHNTDSLKAGQGAAPTFRVENTTIIAISGSPQPLGQRQLRHRTGLGDRLGRGVELQCESVYHSAATGFGELVHRLSGHAGDDGSSRRLRRVFPSSLYRAQLAQRLGACAVHRRKQSAVNSLKIVHYQLRDAFAGKTDRLGICRPSLRSPRFLAQMALRRATTHNHSADASSARVGMGLHFPLLQRSLEISRKAYGRDRSVSGVHRDAATAWDVTVAILEVTFFRALPHSWCESDVRGWWPSCRFQTGCFADQALKEPPCDLLERTLHPKAFQLLAGIWSAGLAPRVTKSLIQQERCRAAPR